MWRSGLIWLWVFLLPTTQRISGSRVQEPEPVQVRVGRVERGDLLRRVEVNGRARAARDLVTVAPMSGRLDSIFVREGQRVVSGERVARFGQRDAEMGLLQAEAALLRATIAYGQGLGERRHAVVAGSGADPLLDLEALEQAHAELLERHPPEASSVRFAERAVAAARLFAQASKSAMIAARTGLAGAIIARDRARLALDRTIVRVPFSGRIADVAAAPHDYMASGAPLLRVVDCDSMDVEMDILESEAGLVREGAGVDVRFLAAPARRFAARVRSLNPALDPSRMVQRAVARLSLRRPPVLPGMHARIAVVVERADNVLKVPRDALVWRGDRALLYVVGPDVPTRVRWQYVEPGLASETHFEVRPDGGALREGELVVLSNQLALGHGARVAVTAE